MMTNKMFFGQLQEEQEYYNCFMTAETFSGIAHELREQILVNTVQKVNNAFKTDELHKSLVREVSRAKSELIKYEFEQNNKVKP